MSSSSSVSAEAAPPWTELPRELTAAILLKLGADEILSTAQKVCKTWWRVCQDPAMWRRIEIRQYTGDLYFSLDLEKMCRRAVDLSQGQLTHITINDFGSDHLLLYIAQRSSQIRSLELVYVMITGRGLSEALKSFALLEELHLHYTPIGKEVVDIIGRCCPLLTSFKLNSRWAFDFELPLAIARNLPLLCHLQLIGNSINNEGLEAILDGCPRLESLDLRKCPNVRIVGNLERLLCSKRFKDLRLPSDPMDDYPFADLDNSENVHYDIDHHINIYFGYFEEIGLDYRFVSSSD